MDSIKLNEMKLRDKEAGIYDSFLSNYQKKLERIVPIEKLAPGQDEKILDAGCGIGMLSKEISNRKSKVFGVDFSVRSLNMFRAGCQSAFPVKSDVCKLPFKTGAFDKVLSTGVFEHIPSRKERINFLREIKRVVKRKGRIVLTTYNYNLKNRLVGNRKGFHKGKIYYLNYSSRELKKIISGIFPKFRISGFLNLLPYHLHCFGPLSYSIDRALEKSRLSLFLGFFLMVEIENV